MALNVAVWYLFSWRVCCLEDLCPVLKFIKVLFFRKTIRFSSSVCEKTPNQYTSTLKCVHVLNQLLLGTSARVPWGHMWCRVSSKPGLAIQTGVEWYFIEHK